LALEEEFIIFKYLFPQRDKMKYVGKVQNISPYGRLIIRVDKTPEIGTPVYTKDKKLIGSVRDIFGPEKRPYIAIEVKDKSKAMSYLNKDIYLG